MIVQNFLSRNLQGGTQLAGALTRQLAEVTEEQRGLEQGWHALVELQEYRSMASDEPANLRSEPIFTLEIHTGDPDVERVAATCSLFVPYKRQVFDGTFTAMEVAGELQVSFYGAPVHWQNVYYAMQAFCQVQDHLRAKTAESYTRFDLDSLKGDQNFAFWMNAFRVK